MSRNSSVEQDYSLQILTKIWVWPELPELPRRVPVGLGPQVLRKCQLGQTILESNLNSGGEDPEDNLPETEEATFGRRKIYSLCLCK